MAILGWIGWGLSVLINLYMMVLFARVILDWVQFSRTDGVRGGLCSSSRMFSTR